jgi:hypothetical protein
MTDTQVAGFFGVAGGFGAAGAFGGFGFGDCEMGWARGGPGAGGAGGAGGARNGEDGLLTGATVGGACSVAGRGAAAPGVWVRRFPLRLAGATSLGAGIDCWSTGSTGVQVPTSSVD